MYAVVSSGGKQYRVEAGTTLTLERVPGEPGAALTFDRILLIGDGDDVTVGTPVVPGASVSATVLGEALGPKLVIFKFKQKVKYRRRTGHRQHLTRVRIDAINPTPRAEGEEPKAKRAAKPAATKAAATKPAATKAPTKPAATRKAAAAKPAASKATADPAPKPRGRAAKPKTDVEE